MHKCMINLVPSISKSNFWQQSGERSETNYRQVAIPSNEATSNTVGYTIMYATREFKISVAALYREKTQ